MALFRKKADPISDRARALNSEIAALEAQIRKYESKLDDRAPDHSRSGSLFANQPVSTGIVSAYIESDHREVELADPRKLAATDDLEAGAIHVNELGVQKYDLPGLLARLRSFFRAPTTSNPKLVSYLAAGGIQGLRPLRYEKRVARNRFLVFVGILFLLLLGILFVFVPR